MPSWPPAHADILATALSRVAVSAIPVKASGMQDQPGVGDDAGSANNGDDVSITITYHAAIFDELVPLLDYDSYRSAVVSGLVISMGGITESTAKDAKRALLKH